MRILLLGDVMLGENLFHVGRGIKSKFKCSYSSLIDQSVKQILFNNVDLVFLNFEYSLRPKCFSQKSINDEIYLGDIDSLEFLDNNFSKLFNIANNHFSQHGELVSRFTKKILRKKNISIIGDKFEPFVIQRESKNYCFWGFSTISDNLFCNEYNLVELKSIIEFFKCKVKKSDEIWVISLHWGDEYVTQPSSEQVYYAHELINIGFDLIIGHHPHVIQPIECYKNKMVLYSLGNFLFDQNFSEQTTQGLAVIYDFKEPQKSLFYLTKQENFIINKIIEINQNKFSLLENYDYENNLKKVNRVFRRKMKLEYLRSFFQTDKRVITALLKKKLFK